MRTPPDFALEPRRATPMFSAGLASPSLNTRWSGVGGEAYRKGLLPALVRCLMASGAVG